MTTWTRSEIHTLLSSVTKWNLNSQTSAKMFGNRQPAYILEAWLYSYRGSNRSRFCSGRAAQRHRAPLRLCPTQGFAVRISRNWAVKGRGIHCGAAFQGQVTFLQLIRLVVQKLLDDYKLKAGLSARIPSA
jgi:hypothetical protein